MLNQMWFSRGSLNVMQSFSNINVCGSSVWVLLRQHMARGQCRSSPRDPPFTRMAFFTGAAFSPKDAPSFSPPLFSSSQHCPPPRCSSPLPLQVVRGLEPLQFGKPAKTAIALLTDWRTSVFGCLIAPGKWRSSSCSPAVPSSLYPLRPAMMLPRCSFHGQ